MDNKRLDTLIGKHADSVEKGSPGYWQYTYRGQTLLTITDESHNRMRIIAPVALANSVDDAMLRQCMEANFDRALDARYALSGEYLWSAFIHPLHELSEQQFLDGINQVATLAGNYGTTFTSGDLSFGAHGTRH